MNLKNKKLVVVGGTGFIGKHVLNLLVQSGAHVWCLTRKKQVNKMLPLGVKYIVGDYLKPEITTKKILKEVGGSFDILLMMAASIPEEHDEKDSFMQSKMHNCDLPVAFVEQIAQSCSHIVFTSTVDVYGIPQKANFKEDQPFDPKTDYAASKVAAEFLMKRSCEAKGVSLSILRLAQVFGPHEPLVRAPSFIFRALNEDSVFTLHGQGKDVRRFLYVKDAAAAIVLAAMRQFDGILNISGKQNISIRQLIAATERVFGKKIATQQVNNNKQPTVIAASSAMAKKKIGFVPRYNLISALKDIRNEI